VPPAAAKSYRITDAKVVVVVADDGSLIVREDLTFSYSGTFEGAYRDIPVASGQQITDVVVSEDEVPYAPGANTELGSSGAPDTYGVADLGSRVRVVWHYRASDEDRVYTLTYRMTGLAVAYDDVVDVYLKVWGDEWDFSLDDLNAAMVLPPGAQDGDVRVWGHPSSVHGATDLGFDGVTPTLTAANVPSRQWVEMRVTFPRSLLSSAGGASVQSGNGLDGILAEESAYDVRGQRDAAAAAEKARARNTSLATLLLFLIPIPVGVLWAFRRYGSEPKVDYDREYEQEPPSDHPPAIVGALVSQGTADEAEFTATLFDLIRQSVLTAEPVSVDRSTWAGLRHEQISDLQIGSAGGDLTLKEFERSVLTIVERVVSDGPTPLSEFRKKIRDDAAANATTYKVFRDRVHKAVRSAGLIDDSARITGPLILAAGLIGIGVFGFYVLAPFLDAAFALIDQDVLRPGIVVVTVFGFRRGRGDLVGDASAGVGAPDEGRSPAQRPMGGLPHVPSGLQSPRGGTADVAHPVGEIPDLRHHPRRGRGRARGRASQGTARRRLE